MTIFIKNNFNNLQQEIKKICDLIHKDYHSITTIAVSKGRNIDDIKTLYDLGHQDFGENKVQEINRKIKNINNKDQPLTINWHFIGHLQTNKVAKLIPYISTLHSLNSLKLLETIESYYGKIPTNHNIAIANRLECFIQVNIAREEQKKGILVNELEPFLLKCKKSKAVKIKGLMTIAPLSSNAEDSRKIFQELKFLANKYDLDELSMGMTNDYKIALEEGATSLRIGRLIFERNGSVIS
ncbi:MAG: YggS family pyridoxal phosphate-dependent enzyme [Dehalococcoidia bacterium]|nr:YggS family pyridoxal phosphate-dependent enzyme [Dehalococcoidia bacterium]